MGVVRRAIILTTINTADIGSPPETVRIRILQGIGIFVFVPSQRRWSIARIKTQVFPIKTLKRHSSISY